MNKNLMVKVGFLAFALFTLTACSQGKQTSGTSEEASRLGSDTDTSKATARCNTSTSNFGFQVVLGTFTDHGTDRNDLMYFKVNSLPSNFQTSGSYFQMFRWQAPTAGLSPSVDTTPLSFKVYRRSNGQLILDSRTSLAWTDMNSVASTLGISTASEFMNATWIVLDTKDVAGAYDAIMTVLYNSSNTQQGRADTLMPIFYADPNNYAVDNGAARHSALQSIHPFKSLAGAGYTQAQFQTMATQMCNAF